MKSSGEVVKYIDNYMEMALQRPSMFASSPQSLEDSFFLLVTVIEFLLEMKPAKQVNSYQAFLQAKGFGVGHFIRRYYPERRLSDQDQHVYAEFAKFFGEFLCGLRSRIRNHIPDYQISEGFPRENEE